uniref:DUF5110 domain-containing protein n=2 Tax=Aplanochytrium stocchinoi TaxID=215587 RepID=A0A7S3PMI1_9STRA
MVNIVDPHIKRDNQFSLHKEAEKNGYYIKTKDGKDFDGWCWPGSSSYLDFTSPKVRDFWADRFSFQNYPGSTDILHIWNDMNEPSVFNGPEVTISKDTVNLEGVEFREFHNLYGFYHQCATSEGLIRRSGNSERSFVLSRAFFAGSQRFGAIWTGDNAAEWSHLAASIPMLLTIGLAGLPFAGADVGGFFGNPDTELLTRWYQAGAFQPFFRAHAHIDTKRREPWLFGDETLRILRDVVRQRYTWLPYIYGLYKESEEIGVPVMRSLWMHYPQDTKTFANEDQWLLGADLLIAPVIVKDAVHRNVYFPGKDRWYDIISHSVYEGGNEISIAASLSKIPVFQRGGSIVSRKMRARRSSQMMITDPYTLTVALDPTGNAAGSLYIDDESSFEYKTQQKFCYVEFTYSRATLSGVPNCAGGMQPMNSIEKLIIVGEARKIESIIGPNKTKLDFIQNDSVTEVKLPVEFVCVGFNISLQF